MDFSLTTFTIEVNGVPTVTFQSKWQADADQICRDWLHTHWDEFSKRGPAGVELPRYSNRARPRSFEREAYEVGGVGFEFCGVIKVVNLIQQVERHKTEVLSSSETKLERKEKTQITPAMEDSLRTGRLSE